MDKTFNSSQHQIFLGLLKQARLEKSITQEMLAGRIGMSQSDISKVERGVRRLDVLELRVWLRGLDVSLPAFSELLDERLAASEIVAKQVVGRRQKPRTR